MNSSSNFGSINSFQNSHSSDESRVTNSKPTINLIKVDQEESQQEELLKQQQMMSLQDTNNLHIADDKNENKKSKSLNKQFVKSYNSKIASSSKLFKEDQLPSYRSRDYNLISNEFELEPFQLKPKKKAAFLEQNSMSSSSNSSVESNSSFKSSQSSVKNRTNSKLRKDYNQRRVSQLLKENIAKRMKDRHDYQQRKKMNPVYRFNNKKTFLEINLMEQQMLPNWKFKWNKIR